MYESNKERLRRKTTLMVRTVVGETVFMGYDNRRIDNNDITTVVNDMIDEN